MSFLNKWLAVLVAGLFLGSFGAVAPTLAGPAEEEFLQSYIGQWQGTGVLKGGDQDERFSCRIDVAKGNRGRINYNGRCAVAGLNLIVSGTIAYIDERRRYEAVMSSNADFRGEAVGVKRGDAVVFDLKERGTDDKGNDMTISTQVSLRGNTIGLGYNVLFNKTNDQSNASVNFSRSN